jgi:hypothetical protein
MMPCSVRFDGGLFPATFYEMPARGVEHPFTQQVRMRSIMTRF